MKNYVIAIRDIDRSMQAAQRCIESGARHGVDIEVFDAVTPRNTDVLQFLREEEMSIEGFKEIYSRLENCVAAFASHYTLWKMCSQSKNEFTIFEHDSIIVDTIPENIPYDKVINLGKPSYGRYNTPQKLGVNPLVSKRYFPGAHAYRLNSKGADILIQQAKRHARPTDVFLHMDTFPFLQEYYPWPVEAKDSFSTIQRNQGCLAKHGYGEGYELL
jgi:GR25 family glycosyltransferase involved in LPS biosynthesis